MSTTVVYDTGFGNTAKVAQAIAAALPGGAAIHRISDFAPGHLPQGGLLIAGSPTQGGRPTPAMLAWLNAIPADRLAGTAVCAFDTRMEVADQGFALRMIMGVIGYAAPRILKALEAKGGYANAEPAGFIVEGREGPLREGELERAAAWARRIGAAERAAA